MTLIPGPTFSAFDVQLIHDDGWRRHYLALQKRFHDQARFLEVDYGFKGRRIDTHFVEIDFANASVEALQDNYRISIAHAFPLLLKALFSRVMADADVLPWAPLDGVGALQEVPVLLSLDAANIADQIRVVQDTSVPRERIALLLSDIAMEFVFLHEIAHILCGHVDANMALMPGSTCLAELSLTKRSSSKMAAISRAWECEADLIAANLLKTYIGVLATHATPGRAGASLDAILQTNDAVTEQCISLAFGAIYVLFRFLGETRERLRMTGGYPDPLVRAFAVRGALFQSMAGKHRLDKQRLEDLTTSRLEEFNQSLDRMGLRTGMPWQQEAPEHLEVALADLFRDRQAHAHLFDRHRFFVWK